MRNQLKTQTTAHNFSFTANIPALGRGLYDIIREHPQGECLRIGMFPDDLIQSFEASLDDIIPDRIDDLATTETIDGRAIKAEILHETIKVVLSLAKEDNILLV